MYNYTKYLLRTQQQVLDFGTRYAEWIRQAGPAYVRWVNDELPKSDQWVSIERDSEKETGMIIGLLCWLYYEKEINISFNAYASAIRKEPRNREEYEQWNKKI